ncbi:hypothetical protein [Clostridium beijerinckii]|jgi:hypothetical protein|uniref:Uncharacterized protein n=2 Tax=Clostridium beijerinckii TaxID=1520 RepID=A0AAE2UYC1_CLOBE|nr:hypothetical protein [Clostridium beijerinckii]ABR33543.1 hypothetical protein Cbei_1363 [Clostridium beijerinckii NCIMB 8052]AIU04859.1 hypothetical protein Cbs_1363 [Clostridium beijerinckii ATCC 35702]MBF7811959.1 hypothetical protein [Clostridium beijerinckii]NRT25190.1 hypothetical protein [Clostridium beijerinckii]NRT67216.1 hypothetical protein [Clostridium beijerinckii]
MKKECNVIGIKNGEKFKFRFMFDESDYLEKLCEELTSRDVMLEDVFKLCIN